MLASWRASLWTKILAVVAVSTFVALGISTVALLLYEIYNYRSFLRSDLQTQADILARTTAPALAFDDPEGARADLELLESRSSFEAAALYDINGAIVATFEREDQDRAWPPPPSVVGEIRIADGGLELFHPVFQSGNRLGTIYLRARYDIRDRALAYLLILVTVMGLALVAATLISIAVIGSVTRPLQSVTGTARRVIEERDFSLRAVRTTDDEVGVLVDAFNAMLREVGARTAELEEANRTLQLETETRRRAEEGLREADRRKDEFLATLAHELRNPLAPMMNSLSILKSADADSAMAGRSLGILERQLAQLVRLVEDLLDVSRITSGKLTIRKQLSPLKAIVRSAVETVEPQLATRGLRLEIALPEQEVHLLADASRLAQVLANLLNNSIKFSEPGSAISLKAEADDKIVRIEVADRGAGISRDSLEHIFEMFSQGETQGGRAQTGLGVGLALAKQLTLLHDGKIDASSEGRGRGATFTLTLPRAASPVAPPAAERPVAPSESMEATPARVLLVDDNVDFASSLAQLFGVGGHDVRVAHDGESGLAIAREFKPEVCILDIGLPDMSGHDLARRLRVAAGDRKPVLIAISGWGMEEDRRRSLDAGFALHLVKPVDYRTVRDAMRELRRKGAA